MVRYANSRKRRFTARIASLVAILVMIPAGYTFYNVFRESRYMLQARKFINETIAAYQFEGQGRFMDNLTDIKYNREGESLIEVITMGDEQIPDNIINTWRQQKNNYSYLQNTVLHVVQGGRDDSEEKFNFVNELYESKKAELLNKDERIGFLESELATISKQASKRIPFREISAEAKANYDNLNQIGFSYKITTDFSKIDTLPVFEVSWKKGVSRKQLEDDTQKLNNWLKLRLQDSTVRVQEIPD